MEFAKTMKIGNGLNPENDLGPIQNKMQFEKVKELIEDTKQSGVKIVLGGEIEDKPGYFIPITMADNPPEDSRVVVDEAFRSSAPGP